MAGPEVFRSDLKGDTSATGGTRCPSTGSGRPQSNSFWKGILQKRGNPHDVVVGWLAGLAGGGSSRDEADSSEVPTPGSPPTMVTGEDVTLDDEDDAFTASREVVERAIDEGEAKKQDDVPGVHSTPDTTSVVAISVGMSVAQPSLVSEDPIESSTPKRLSTCSECQASISGAVFMLHDRPFCCQRHRLAAYHKLDRSDGRRATLPTADDQPCGLRAQYERWI